MAASDSSLTAATTTANILPVHIFETSATTGQSGGSGGNVISVAFHPEGSWLWSASEEGQLRVWDLQGSFGLKKEIHLGSPLTAAVLHPDYEHVLVGDELGRLRLIHMDLAENERAVGSGEVTRELGRMSGQPKGGGTSSSSSTVILNSSMSASLTPRHRVQVVAETRTSQRVAIRDMAISSDGTFVAAIDHRGQLHLWRLDRVPAVAPSTSSTGETGSANGGVRVTISTETDDPYTATMTEEQPVYILEFVHVASVNAHGSYGIKCMFSPDTTTVLTTSADTTARLWAMPASGGPPVEGKGDGERGEGGGGSAKNGVDSGVPTTGNISAVDEVSREGSKTSSTDHITASANLLIPPPVPSTSSREVSRSGSPSILTAPSSVISSLPLIQEFIGHTKWVWDCAFSADSAYVITASSDESIRLWDVNSGLSIATYAGHSKAITCVALNDLPLQ